MRIAIVDDNKRDLEEIRRRVEAVAMDEGYDFKLDVYTDSINFVEKYKGEYDVIFLDIEMPLYNGMDVAKKIRQTGSDCNIIFITNMPQFAIQGYEVDAIGYIIKPAKLFAIKDVLKKASRVSARKTNSVNIVLNIKQEVIVLKSPSIYYIEAQGHDLTFYTEKGNYTCRKTLGEIEKLLFEMPFVKCNRCYLVNLKHVQSISNNDVIVAGARLGISRNRKKEFVEKFMEYTR